MEFNDDRPLTENEWKKLRHCRKFLVDHLDCPDCLKQLRVRDVLTSRHEYWINKAAEDDFNHRNRLIEVIERRSFKHYQLFLTYLRLHNLSNAADALEDEGGILSLFKMLIKKVRKNSRFA